MSAPPPWAAEREVDAEEARTLIRAASFPGVRAERVEPLGRGWDNVVFLVDGAWAFRFPRRELGARLLAIEIETMPRIAPFLAGAGVPVATPRHVGEPTRSYRWPFAGHRFLPGRAAAEADLGDDLRMRLAAPLGRFLRALHQVPVSDFSALATDADGLRKMDAAHRAPQATENLELLAAAGVIDEPARWQGILEELPTGPRPEVVCHGDLYGLHVLVDDAGDLAGVIDWGDVHRGDPAVDGMVAEVLLPPEARAAFDDAYGGVDDVTRRLRRFRALVHTTWVARGALDQGNDALLRETRRALAWLAA